MKKLLALVLALIMVLGLGVTAFAIPARTTAEIIVLNEEDDDDDDEPEAIINLLEAFGSDEDDTVFLACPYSRDYYFELGDYDLYKNYNVTTTGNVTAEIVEFNGEELYYRVGKNIDYRIYDTKKPLFNEDGLIHWTEFDDYKADKPATATILTKDCWNEKDYDKVGEAWDDAQDVADDLNDAYKEKDRFEVRACAYNAEGVVTEIKDKHLLKVTTADNFSAAYKEGTVKITATEKSSKDTFVAEFTVISDVTIFEYEMVKWAADNEPLVLFDGGYSDYLTAKNGYAYGTNGHEYDIDDLRVFPGATVVSTTAFRAIEGSELEVETPVLRNEDPFATVTIDEVAKGQKGVNFFFEGPIFYDEDGDELIGWTNAKGDTDKFEFGFLGDQVIASDFEITVNLGRDYFELRELFGKKVEEEDIITYYILKDGVKFDEFTVDYKDDEIDEDVELEILGKAGDKLGYYTITLDAPAEEEGGEENPNTGAESVVGVVAAMAVISLVSAAAVSLKK